MTEEKKARKAPVRHQVDELEIMRKADKLLTGLPGTETRQRVVQWLYDRYNGPGYLSPSRANAMLDDITGDGP